VPAAAVIGGLIVLAALIVAAVSLLRFRRARGVLRQQLRWLALAAVAMLVAAIAALTLHDSVVLTALGVCVALLPLATGASTGTAATPPRPSSCSAPACASTSTWTR
jgi:uncharacterized membrane protein YfcA